MASSRDDFIIAIRSAFLKKSTQQKFSLLTLIFLSVFVIVLSNLNLKAVRLLKTGINEVVYRSSFIVSIPENFLKNSYINILEYSTFFRNYKKNEKELNELKSQKISNEIIQYENKELKNLINDYVSSSDKILAKIIVDHDSPFLKSVIINKGSNSKIKIGTNIYDQSYLVGRVVEVNYNTSRVLLLSDLNSNVPVTIAPQNIQAIMIGGGKDNGEIKYIKDGIFRKFDENSIIYTSGTGGIFKSGIPIGKLEQNSNNLGINFFSDFSQLKYVFAEVEVKTENPNFLQESNDKSDENNNPINTKIQILEDEKKIIEDSNLRFKEENENLKLEINYLNTQISSYQNELTLKKNEINQSIIDQKELEFLRLNLLYSHKCQTRKLFSTGYKVGTPEYKECILNKGKIND